MDRKRWSFPQVGVAAARVGGEARIALAGVAPIPWLLEGSGSRRGDPTAADRVEGRRSRRHSSRARARERIIARNGPRRRPRAAGASSRYGTSRRSSRSSCRACSRRSASRRRRRRRRRRGASARDGRAASCPDWELGPGASLRCGLAALPAEAEAAVVVLADGPDLDPRAVDRVVESGKADGGEPSRPRTAASRLHPVLLARAVWSHVPDEGARGLEARLVACDDLSPPGDVDVRR